MCLAVWACGYTPNVAGVLACCIKRLTVQRVIVRAVASHGFIILNFICFVSAFSYTFHKWLYSGSMVLSYPADVIRRIFVLLPDCIKIEVIFASLS